jgi:hypothetical protein
MLSRADCELLVLRGLRVFHCDVVVCLVEAGDCWLLDGGGYKFRRAVKEGIPFMSGENPCQAAS